MSKEFKWVIGIIGAFVLFVLVAAFHSISQDDKKKVDKGHYQSNESNIQKSKDNTVKLDNLGLTYHQFADRFNQVAKTREQQFRIRNTDVNWSEKKDAFSIVINKNVLVSGILENEILKEIFVIGSGDGTVVSGGNILFGLCTVVEALSTETKNPCNQVLDLMEEAHNKVNDDSAVMVLDGVKYSMSVSKKLGTVLYVEKFRPYKK